MQGYLVNGLRFNCETASAERPSRLECDFYDCAAIFPSRAYSLCLAGLFGTCIRSFLQTSVWTVASPLEHSDPVSRRGWLGIRRDL